MDILCTSLLLSSPDHCTTRPSGYYLSRHPVQLVFILVVLSTQLNVNERIEFGEESNSCQRS